MEIAMDSLANEGLLFPTDLMAEIKDRFLHVDRDPDIGERLFFDNAGGSFRLKKANEVLARIDAVPDCPERNHRMALQLQQIQDDGIGDVKIIFNAEGGSVFTALTASEAMFDVVRAIAENVSGTNMVTTVLEHPSAYDAMVLYADRLGKELRVASSNPVTGGVDVEEITRLVDKDTCLLNVMFASNISGAVLDIEAIVAKARAIKPDLFIVVDAVQHVPHGFLDLQRAPGAKEFVGRKCYGINRGSLEIQEPVGDMLDRIHNDEQIGFYGPGFSHDRFDVKNRSRDVGSEHDVEQAGVLVYQPGDLLHVHSTGHRVA